MELEKKELPESALDYLIELWLRQKGLEAVSITKIPKEEETATA